MKKIVLFLNILLIGKLYSQDFVVQNNTSFLNLTTSNSDVGDYDNDGDLDILVSGLQLSSNEVFTNIYNNDGAGNFTLSSVDIDNKIRNGQVAFIDYDNDNDLDVFLSGFNSDFEHISFIYENTGITEPNTFVNFEEVPFNFSQENISNNQFIWEDLDNDGDLDLILMGNVDAVFNVSYMYKNQGNNNFSIVENNFTPFSQGKILSADIDKDGDNDLVISGLDDDFNSFLKIYKNKNDFNFEETQTLEGFFNGNAELRDVNNDSWLDIIKTGDTSSNSAKIYFGNSNFNFIDSNITLTNVGDNSNIVSADFDGNGELDFFVSGRLEPYTSLILYTGIYYNSGNLDLTENNNIGIPNGAYDDIKIADFDNDDDLDIFKLDNNISNIYKNQINTQNLAPIQPSGLTSEITENNVVLNWVESSDNESPSEQLTYNIYVGTEPFTTNTVSPLADLNTGFRRVVGIGNAQNKINFHLKNLPPDTYYWSVQTIDNQYKASGFAEEKTFIIESLSIEDFEKKSIIIYPNPVKSYLTITNNNFNFQKATVYSVLGEKIIEKEVIENKLNLTNLKKGIYFLSIKNLLFKILKE